MRRRDFIKGTVGASLGMTFIGCQTKSGNGQSKHKIQAHKILSCNIRVALLSDEEKGVGWNSRKEICVKVIKSRNPDIICLQEVIRVQAEDMQRSFPGFTLFGFKGPEMDKYSNGYYGIAKNVILFSEDKYELVSAGCYWLSKTPVIGGSMSWETKRARHLNWVRLKDNNTKKEFRILNTHLDHFSQNAREKQIEMIMDESSQYTKDFPQLLAGDFNEDSTNDVIKMIKRKGWTDTYTAIHNSSDPGFTYHGFIGPDFPKNYPEVKPKNKIDFIFSHGKVEIENAHIIKDNVNSIYPSDHYFISCEFEL